MKNITINELGVLTADKPIKVSPLDLKTFILVYTTRLFDNNRLIVGLEKIYERD